IQVYPKDLPALPVHPEPAVSWDSGFRGGAHARHKTTPVHHPPRRRGGGLAAAARAQQGAISVIGFLSGPSPNESHSVVKAFREGLREGGFVEGENLFIAFRWAEGRYDRLPALAAELVGLRVALLFAAGGTPSALAAKASTSTIPIVFSAVGDPIGAGLIASLNRPGGNVTSMSVLAPATVGKRIELLRQLVPHATSIGYLRNPSNPSSELESNEA